MNRCVSITCALVLSLSPIARADSPAPCGFIDQTNPDWDIYSKLAISKMCERYPDDCGDMQVTTVCSDKTTTDVTIEVRGEFFTSVRINRSTKEISSMTAPRPR